MSSESSYIASLRLIQTNLYKFGGPVLMSIGTASCILSLIVFTKKNLRKNPCSIYLVAVNISNLLLICTSILFSTLSVGYSIDPSLYNRIFCRFRFYMIELFDILSPSYLILASVDRILLTSRNALTRQRSTRRLAYICITSVTIFWALFHSHALVLTNIIQLAPGFYLCYFQPGIYSTLVSYYSAIKGVLVPLLMIILGLWSVKNIRKVGRINPVSVAPTTGITVIRNVSGSHSKDRQLLQILLIDISVYIIFNIMIAVVLMYQQFSSNQSTGLVQARIQLLLTNVGVFSTYIPFCIGCYTNLLISKTFRHEIKNVIMCK